MIVCSCNVISHSDVEAAIADAPQTMSQIYRSLGHKTHCGRCVRTIRDMMREGGKDGCGDPTR